MSEWTLVRSLTGHDQRVSSVAFVGHTIVSGSWDATIKVWNMNTGECRNTLKTMHQVHSVDLEQRVF